MEKALSGTDFISIFVSAACEGRRHTTIKSASAFFLRVKIGHFHRTIRNKGDAFAVFSAGIFPYSTVRVVQYLTCGYEILPAPFVYRDGNNPLNKINEMKTAKFFMAFIAAALLASCSDKDNDYSGDFGQIKVPDTRQLEQTAGSDDTQAAQGVTFTTEGPWTSTIAQTRAEAPDWISVSPDHGDAAGTYTLKITLESNGSEESRSATIVITCGSSKIEISVTQEGTKDDDGGDEPVERAPNGRLVKITEYVGQEVESVAVITYDDSDDSRSRIKSFKMYWDETLADLYEEYLFTYDDDNLRIEEKHYDKLPTIYGKELNCPDPVLTPRASFIGTAECHEIAGGNNYIYHFDYSDEQLSTVTYESVDEDGPTGNKDEDRYIYQDRDCTKITWGALSGTGGTQTFTYDEEKPHEFERLFASYPAIDPALYVISDPDMLRMLGFLGHQSTRLPEKVVTNWGSDSETETLTYKYKDLTGWKIGAQIEGMEITVKSSISREARFVLTFEGI